MSAVLLAPTGGGDGDGGGRGGSGDRPNMSDPDSDKLDIADDDDDDDDDDDETSSSSAFFTDSSMEYIMEMAVTHASIRRKAKKWQKAREISFAKFARHFRKMNQAQRKTLRATERAKKVAMAKASVANRIRRNEAKVAKTKIATTKAADATAKAAARAGRTPETLKKKRSQKTAPDDESSD